MSAEGSVTHLGRGPAFVMISHPIGLHEYRTVRTVRYGWMYREPGWQVVGTVIDCTRYGGQRVLRTPYW
jgi:hypothetical protein